MQEIPCGYSRRQECVCSTRRRPGMGVRCNDHMGIRPNPWLADGLAPADALLASTDDVRANRFSRPSRSTLHADSRGGTRGAARLQNRTFSRRLPRFARRVLFDSFCPAAGGPAADSAIIDGVETLPAAFAVDPEGLVRHIRDRSGQKRHGTGGGDDLGDDRNFFDAGSQRAPSGFPNGPQTERRKTRTTPKLNAERSPRTPGTGSSAP